MLLGASAMAATPLATARSAAASEPATYDEAAAQVWRPLDGAGGLREIIRAGTLAANSHNTQPWRFSLSGNSVVVRPDCTRRLPVVDPDDHHVFASIGCAIENMVQAAPQLGFAADARFDGQERVTVDLVAAPARTSELSNAITSRQCTRADYDGQALEAGVVASLAEAGALDGVACEIITDRKKIEATLDYVVQGNTAQLRDKAFVRELTAWIRFSERAALAQRDGLAARCTGNPSIPDWLGKLVLPFVMTEKGENEKYAKQIRSSAGIAVFAAPADDRAGWIAAGRAYQRFALKATALGIRHAFINQPVEVSALRPQFASFLGLGARRPDLVVRFGRGPAMPPSLRRPLEAVVDAA